VTPGAKPAIYVYGRELNQKPDPPKNLDFFGGGGGGRGTALNMGPRAPRRLARDL